MYSHIILTAHSIHVIYILSSCTYITHIHISYITYNHINWYYSRISHISTQIGVTHRTIADNPSIAPAFGSQIDSLSPIAFDTN